MKNTLNVIAVMAILISLAACGTDAKPAGESDTTTPTEVSAGSASFVMKQLDIHTEYVFPDGETVRGTRMDASSTAQYKPQSIDEFHMEGDVYYVADTLSVADSGSIYLIVKYDPNETTGWLVIYDNAMRVSDMIEVYYENAEGNFMLTSRIHDHIVTTTGDNVEPEEKAESHFRIDGMRWHLITDSDQ